MKGGDAFIFSANNVYNVKSPYVEGNRGGSNTELTIVGCAFSNQEPDSSVGLRIIGFAGDVRVYGSYFHSDGFSAIYIDGTKAPVDNISFRDVRIEGEDGKHCLYAKGHVRNVTIDTGAWISNFEPILQEDAKSFTDKRYCTDPNGGAFNWNIKGLSFSIHDGIGYAAWIGHRCPNPEEKVHPPKSDYIFMHFDRLVFSNLECKFMSVVRYWKDEKGKIHIENDFSGEKSIRENILKREKAIVIEKLSYGNTFIVEKKEQVKIKGKKKGKNRIVCLDN